MPSRRLIAYFARRNRLNAGQRAIDQRLRARQEQVQAIQADRHGRRPGTDKPKKG